ncbi:uncharacterized protein Z518_00401 [Rhinocladiella mackenziei CBS 650.93]|uniref:Phospholipid scramblase n=1 Tax=Rhinocladiella mackenziei CBS 650.93 TaxID=1442369 RepID=A0A0D2G3W1_9EURO|nr:uncharacterized protein Z518_00401 [Rhinocladiella mackenziei CBS 650.93]KIX09322.1 hypothetical protein Z518_00401 [Rhinocladiella mackenziei CBS 650.93]
MEKTVFLMSRSARVVLKPRLQFFLASRSRNFTSSIQRNSTAPNPKKDEPQDGSTPSQGQSPPKRPSMEKILAETDPKENPLVAPVHIPFDTNGILKPDHPAAKVLSQSGIVVQRHIELMNILVGFEQANRYVILDPHGNHIGYMAEVDGSLGNRIRRQMFTTHRAFTTHVFDRDAKEVLRFDRPFSWINTRIRVYDPLGTSSSGQTSPFTSVSPKSDPELAVGHQVSPLPLDAMRVIGEAHSQWAPLRRKYDLFLSHDPELSEPGPAVMPRRSAEDLSKAQLQQIARNRPSNSAASFAQFASINEPFLSWDFSLLDEDSRLIGSVNRSFRGFAREVFTDTGSYVLRMDSAGLQEEATHRHVVSQTHQSNTAYAEVFGRRDSKYGMTLDQRAVMLATAVTIDYDYFSRHSGGGGWGFFPVWMGGGGEAAGGAAGAEAAGAAGAAGAGEVGGAVVGGAGRAVGSATGAGAIGEGAIAGAGTMAGYEAMERGLGRDSQAPEPEVHPQQPAPHDQPYDRQSPPSGLDGPDQDGDLWGSGNQDPWSSGGGGESGGESGGFFQWLWHLFFGD